MTVPLRWAPVGAAVLASLLAWQWAGAEETVTVALPPGVIIPEAAQPGGRWKSSCSTITRAGAIASSCRCNG